MPAKLASGYLGLRSVLIVSIGTFATGTDAFIIAGLLPSIASDLQVSVALAGQMVTVFALAYAVGSPLVMSATASWRRRRVLVASMLLFAGANLVAAVSPNITVLAVSRIVAAVLAGLFVPSATVSVSMLVAPDKRGRALALVLGGTSFATVAGVPLGLLVAGVTSWRGAFGFVAALSVAAAAGIALLLPPVPTPPRIQGRDRLIMLARPDILSVLVITVVANTGAFAVYTYLGLVFNGVGGGRTLPVLILVFGIAAMVGGYLSGHASDTWGPVKVLSVALAVFTVNQALLAQGPTSLVVSLVYMVVWGVVGWGTVPPQQHRLVHLAGDGAGIALSLNASALYLGIGLGGLVGGYVVDTAGAQRLWLVAATCGVLALVLVWVSQTAVQAVARRPA